MSLAGNAICDNSTTAIALLDSTNQYSTMQPRSFVNPVYSGYFADPFVWLHDGHYYAVGTGAAEAAGAAVSSSRPTVFPLLRSANLVDWQPAGHALVRPAPMLGDSFWAPEVAYAEGRWWLYYSVGHGEQRHQLRVACADAPLGPYVDCAQLTDPDDLPFAIDPHPFLDADGRWYLFYARDFLDLHDERGSPVRAGTALAVQPLTTMTRLATDATRTVARARFDWQRFAANRTMYGKQFDWHTLEGPCVLRAGADYYCLYSGGCWQSERYGVDYVVGKSVMGPYRDDRNDHDAEAVSSEPRVLNSVPGRVIGPGHCSVTLAGDRAQPILVYHAWGPDFRARRLCIDRLMITEAGPRCVGPSWTEQPPPFIAAH